MADVLSFRLKQRPVRVAAAISTLFVSLFYLIATTPVTSRTALIIWT